jgi:hypothetical protein
MKRFGWLMAMVLVGALTGCNQQAGTAQKAAVSPGTTLVTGKQVTRNAQNAAELVQSYVQQVREDYLRSVETQLDRLTQRTEKLQAKAEKAGGEVKDKMSAATNTFSNKKDAVKVQLEKVKTATDQPWEVLKISLDATLTELEQAFDAMLSV